MKLWLDRSEIVRRMRGQDASFSVSDLQDLMDVMSLAGLVIVDLADSATPDGIQADAEDGELEPTTPGAVPHTVRSARSPSTNDEDGQRGTSKRPEGRAKEGEGAPVVLPDDPPASPAPPDDRPGDGHGAQGDPATGTTWPDETPVSRFSQTAIVRQAVISGWLATCPFCGGALAPVTQSRPSAARAVSIVHCVSCRRQFVVTITVAVAPELAKGRVGHGPGCNCPPCEHARKTHCDNGHELAGDNLYVTPDGKRVCKACRPESWHQGAA